MGEGARVAAAAVRLRGRRSAAIGWTTTGTASTTMPIPIAPVATELQAEFQAVADDARGPVSALSLAIATADGRVALVASGTTESGGQQAVVPGDRFPIGSVTKSFVATVVMQLRDEGKLSLEETLSKWLPDFPRADRITLRHLLSHTSGIFDYTQDRHCIARINRGQTMTPAEMIGWAADNAPLFEPGADWSYSNSNYILLGAVIEAVTGNTAAAELRTRIFDPLGMKDSFLLGSEEVPGGLLVHGYLEQATGDVDFTELWNGTAAWTAGAIVSTGADMLRFSHGLLEGELLDPASLAEMETPVAAIGGGFGYGYGLLVGADWVGHDGAVPGWRSQWTHLKSGATVVVLQNRYDDGAAIQAATVGAVDAL